MFYATTGFTVKCPHPSQRAMRIFHVCNGNASSYYTCLNDTDIKGYIEFCSPKNDFVRAGKYKLF